jgi:predicted phage tail protein
MEMKQIIKKIEMLGDPNTFSWSQAFSDKTGKTSITAVLASVIIIPSMVVFTISGLAALFSITIASTIMTNSLASLGIGSAIAGVNKVMSGKPMLQDHVLEDDTSKKDDKPPIVQTKS